MHKTAVFEQFQPVDFTVCGSAVEREALGGEGGGEGGLMPQYVCTHTHTHEQQSTILLFFIMPPTDASQRKSRNCLKYIRSRRSTRSEEVVQ